MDLQLLQNRSTLQPKKGHQRDPYIGPLHPQTKKRHGKGNYLFPNKFFQYEGEYVQGKKQGFGIFKMKDGTKLQGTFNQDQIQGEAKVVYPDGSSYMGQLFYGQRNGKGIYQSQFERYEGQWKQNCKEGHGKHSILSTGQVFEGNFMNNKLQGQGSLKSYNYSYNGQWNDGKKEGYGEQTNLWRRLQQQSNSQPVYLKQRKYDSYEYQGAFINDLFHGKGKYCSKTSNYVYEGQYFEGLPINYPNKFRIFLSSNTRNQIGQEKQGDKILLQENSVFQYELEAESKNLYIECVYQGPEYLDEVQFTQEQIQLMAKNWQNENKKNKNPPPMPDFRAPKMKKPELILIVQENGRPLMLTLQKQGEGVDKALKIDYRKQITLKRSQIQKMKEELKKNEEQDPKKKGSKKEAKNENQFKINAFKDSPTLKEKSLKIQTNNGISCFRGFELPDDFPQGKFLMTVQSRVEDYGMIRPRKIQLLVKSKQAATKKK